MEVFRGVVAALVSGMLRPFAGRNAMLGLAPLGVLAGVGMLWVFRRTSNQAAIRQVKRQLQAHLYELRLFADEPALIWRAQAGLLAANARYLGLMLVPALVLTAPMAILFAHLEAFYGLEPLPLGQPALVTVQMNAALDPRLPPRLEAPDGIAVETPAVRDLEARQVSWRIRPLAPVSGYLRVVLPGEAVEKSVAAGSGPRYLSSRRVRPALDLIWHPAERRLPAGVIDWVEVGYPPAKVHWLGMDLPWLVWLLGFSLLSALVLKRRFGVSL